MALILSEDENFVQNEYANYCNNGTKLLLFVSNNTIEVLPNACGPDFGQFYNYTTKDKIIDEKIQ